MHALQLEPDNFGRLYQLYADLWVERGCNMIFGD